MIGINTADGLIQERINNRGYYVKYVYTRVPVLVVMVEWQNQKFLFYFCHVLLCCFCNDVCFVHFHCDTTAELLTLAKESGELFWYASFAFNLFVLF